MADYYVDTSQTFNGDGTASTSAASDGAVGAANSFIEVMTGTHATIGTLAAGSNVYIRTHDGTSNCEEPMTVSKTIVTNATAALPVTFIFDDGTKWAGDSGQFRLYTTAAIKLTLDAYVIIDAGDSDDRRFKFEISHTASTVTVNSGVVAGTDSHLNGVELDGSGAAGMIYIATQDGFIMRDILFKPSVTNPTHNDSGFILGAHGDNYECYNLVVDYGTFAGTEDSWVYRDNSTRGAYAKFVGGKILNGNNRAYFIYDMNYFSERGGAIEVVGFDFGSSGFSLMKTRKTNKIGVRISYVAPAGAFGFDYIHNDIAVDFIDNGSFPYVTGSNLPDSGGTGWSYRGYISRSSDDLCVVDDFPMQELAYGDTSAQKTATMELLVHDNESPTKDRVWMEVLYVDNVSGDTKYLTTKATAVALDSSTANWSSTSFGAETFTKYKLSIQTPTAIKQNSTMFVMLKSNFTPLNISNPLFYSPSVVLS